MVRRAALALLSISWRPRPPRTAPIPTRRSLPAGKCLRVKSKGMAPSTLADRRVRRFDLAGRARFRLTAAGRLRRMNDSY
jgi:hypothetical protein